MAVPDDPDRSAVDAEDVEGRLRGSLQHRGEPPGVRVGAQTGCGKDAAQDPKRAAARERPHDGHREHFRRQPQAAGERGQEARQRVHRARGPERSDGREDGDQVGDDPHRDLEPFLGAFDEGLVDLHALEPSVERDADQDAGQRPVRARFEDVAEAHRTTRSRSLAAAIATVSAQAVDASVGSRMPAGSLECAAARSAMTVVGTNWRLAVLMATNSACALVAVPGLGFSFSSSSIALIPKGVAAFPSPSMLAAMLRSIAEMAGWPSGTSRKSGRKIGRAARDSFSTRPARSAILRSPSQSAITPRRPMARWTPGPAPS